MPLLVTAVVADRGGRRPSTIAVRLGAQPLGWMIAEDVVVATRAVLVRFLGRTDNALLGADADSSRRTYVA